METSNMYVFSIAALTNYQVNFKKSQGLLADMGQDILYVSL